MVDLCGRTALDEAERNSHSEVTEFLRESAARRRPPAAEALALRPRGTLASDFK